MCSRVRAAHVRVRAVRVRVRAVRVRVRVRAVRVRVRAARVRDPRVSVPRVVRVQSRNKMVQCWGLDVAEGILPCPSQMW